MSSPDSSTTTPGRSVFPDYLSDYALADKEYKEFIKLVLQSPQDLKKELTNFLYPFYVYIFLIFLKEDKLADACKFLSSYSKPFLRGDGFKEVIEKLLKFKTILEVWNDSYFRQFCESKCIVKVSEDGFNCLTLHLEETENRILKFLIELHFEVIVVKDSHHIVNNDSSVEKPTINKSISDEAPFNDLTPEVGTKGDRKQCFTKTKSYSYTINCSKDSLCSVDIRFKHKFLACGFENSVIHVWPLSSDGKDSETGECLTTENNNSVDVFQRKSNILKGHGGAVYGLSFCTSHNLLLSCSEDSTVRAWNLKKLNSAAVYQNHDHPIWDVTVNSSNSFFATASMDLTARLWSFERSKPLRIFAGHTSDVDTVKFHPNSRYLATASADKTLQLWTADDGRSVRTFIGHETYISSIAYSPNGQQLASADDNGHIKIWDLGSGKEMADIKAHEDRILSFAYNKGGTMIASGGFDRCIKVWNVHNCAEPLASTSRETNYTSELYDCHSMNSVVNLVSFRKNGILVSVVGDSSVVT